jgi:hypothetical protein
VTLTGQRPNDGTSVPTLSVEATEHGIRFRLDLPGDSQAEPLQAELHQRVERGALAALQASVTNLLRGGEHPSFIDEARVRGGVLYRTLIPGALRERLHTVAGPLLVSSTLQGLPWELLHDGADFWGIRYALGRRLVTDRPLPTVASLRLPERPRALVIGADPFNDLPFVSREVEGVCSVLAATTDLIAVAGPLSTVDTVTAHLGRSFDIVHFAGHVVVTASGESALLLGDAQALPASVIEAALAGRPIVVLNGCTSADATPLPSEGRERRLAGVVHAFLFGGAVAAVGTLADVGDRHAAALARAFYRHLFEERVIGEALRRARVDLRSDPVTSASPVWLSVGLYGNPALAVRGDAPTRAPAARGPRRLARRAVLAGGLAAALASAAAIVWVTRRPGAGRTPAPVVIGVMAVTVRTGEVPDWIREFTRHALNSALMDVRHVSIFSQEKIDFLCESRRLCGIAGAEALGLTKMISVSLSMAGDTVAFDANVIDIARNGILEGSVHVHGPRDDLIELQNQLALQLLQRLGIELTPDERQHLLSQRTNEMLDGYRMLMKTLGPSSSPAPAPRGEADGTVGGLRGWIALAHADDSEVAIRDLMRRYEQALSAKDIDTLGTLEESMSADRRNALELYFDRAKGLVVRLSDLEVLVEGMQALATYAREDTFVDARTGQRMHLRVRISNRLTRSGNRWVLRASD